MKSHETPIARVAAMFLISCRRLRYIERGWWQYEYPKSPASPVRATEALERIMMALAFARLSP